MIVLFYTLSVLETWRQQLLAAKKLVLLARATMITHSHVCLCIFDGFNGPQLLNHRLM